MKCEHFDQALLYDAGELSSQEVVEIEEHIKACECCSEYLKELSCLRDNKSLDSNLPGNLHKFWIKKPAAKHSKEYGMLIPILYAIAASVFVVIALSFFYEKDVKFIDPTNTSDLQITSEDQEIADTLDSIFSFESFDEPTLTNDSETDIEKALDSIENELDKSLEHYTYEETSY